MTHRDAGRFTLGDAMAGVGLLGVALAVARHWPLLGTALGVTLALTVHRVRAFDRSPADAGRWTTFPERTHLWAESLLYATTLVLLAAGSGIAAVMAAVLTGFLLFAPLGFLARDGRVVFACSNLLALGVGLWVMFRMALLLGRALWPGSVGPIEPAVARDTIEPGGDDRERVS